MADADTYEESAESEAPEVEASEASADQAGDTETEEVVSDSNEEGAR